MQYGHSDRLNYKGSYDILKIQENHTRSPDATGACLQTLLLSSSAWCGSGTLRLQAAIKIKNKAR